MAQFAAAIAQQRPLLDCAARVASERVVENVHLQRQQMQLMASYEEMDERLLRMLHAIDTVDVSLSRGRSAGDN